ncbi:hypothetical protein [Actinacidiphila oryziradicis]|jgi:hypothetical protein|uniref:hypothetical protein n=1 Tax=Actinacidiphila oryziradicis TaxID=2571141 RepID=UPI0023F38452|nr:hypothetical protein [Actinacidiphila oryziradicis]MCW2870711.1 hypothetical protein [Actinacidiphila oryziradicis]
MSEFSRRRFLTYGSASGLALLSAACGTGSTADTKKAAGKPEYPGLTLRENLGLAGPSATPDRHEQKRIGAVA